MRVLQTDGERKWSQVANFTSRPL